MLNDDFGAGASSLDRFSRLDGSFALDCAGDGGRIRRAVVELARKLGMGLAAEFVESAGQEQFLMEIGCTLMQDHYSPALSKSALPVDQ